jgi:hypothetical protein
MVRFGPLRLIGDKARNATSASRAAREDGGWWGNALDMRKPKIQTK